MPKRTPLEVFWSKRALRDSEAIVAYIEQQDPRTAVRVATALLDRAETLAVHPYAGQRVPEYDRDDVRQVLEHGYRVIYAIRGSRIVVLTVLRAVRSLPETLDPDE